MRYRGWADDARKELAKITIPKTFLPFALFAKAFFPIPKGKKKKIRQGAYHRVKPDADNVLKAICDALFPGNDAMVSHVSLIKNYDDGAGERVELEIYFSEER
jgi:Holliday junction resolvase RusA-like endonuclease